MFSLLALLAWVPPAPACVGLVHAPGELAATQGQQILFERDGSDTLVHYRVRYTGDAASFGWVIPVPGEIADVSDGDDARFNQLDLDTQPEVLRVSTVDLQAQGCSCPGTVKAGGDNVVIVDGEPSVRITAEGYTGTYSWQALDPMNPDALSDWLTAESLTAGLPDGTTDVYVNSGAWRFLVVRLTEGQALEVDQLGELPPIVIRYSSTVMAYPAQMARLMTGQRYRATFWVQGPERASLEGWTITEPGYIEGQGPDADAAFDQLVYDAGGPIAGAALTWAGRYEDGWLTRFDSYLDAEAHITDPLFRLDGGTVEASTTLELWIPPEPGGAWILPLSLLGLARRRRSGPVATKSARTL